MTNEEAIRMAQLVNVVPMVSDVYSTDIKVPAVPTAEKIIEVIVVTAASASIYSKPNATSAVVETVSKGAQLRVTEEPRQTSTGYTDSVRDALLYGTYGANDGTFRYVLTAKGKRGWVRANYTASTYLGVQGIITAATALFRSQPHIATGTTYATLTYGTVIYRNEEPVTVQGKDVDAMGNRIFYAKNNGDWCYVYYPNLDTYGWVRIKDSTFVDPTEGEASTTGPVSIMETPWATAKASPSVTVNPTMSKSITYTVYSAPVEENVSNVNVNHGTMPTDFSLNPNNYQEKNRKHQDESLIGNRSRLIVQTYDRKNSKWVAKIFEFTIGPSAMTEIFSNSVVPVRTGGGYILNRMGAEPNRMTISGILLDTAEADERRCFLDKYYGEYLVDKVNAFYDYFNQNRLLLQINGYEYKGVMLGLTLTKSAQSLFTYNYNMDLIITERRRL